MNDSKVGGQAVLGRQDSLTTPWLTGRNGYMTEQFLEKDSSNSQEEVFKNYKLTNTTQIICIVPSSKIGKYFTSEFEIASYINSRKNVNPSIADFINKINEVRAKNIIIIVGDSNFFLSAQQAFKFNDS